MSTQASQALSCSPLHPIPQQVPGSAPLVLCLSPLSYEPRGHKPDFAPRCTTSADQQDGEVRVKGPFPEGTVLGVKAQPLACALDTPLPPWGQFLVPRAK